MIVIGLGSGRCGTASLAKLLSDQPDAHCFHEMNPSCVRFSGTPRPILNAVEEFQTVLNGGDPSLLTVDLSRPVAAAAYERLCGLSEVRLIGDVAFYYLSYFEAMAAHNANVRFGCLRRERETTVESWLHKTRIPRWRSKRIADRLAAWITRTPFYEETNFWMEHDGSRWQKDEVWDKCFPKYEATSKRVAIGQYWDSYYREAERLAALLEGRFQIFDTEALNSRGGQDRILAFCGVPEAGRFYSEARIHTTGSAEKDAARRSGAS
jgi:hypothetical protein